MTSEIRPSSIQSEFLVEIRYLPNAKVIDNRGKWAEEASKLMDLPEWGISENRLDVSNKDKTMGGFVAFRNAGFYIRNNPDHKLFQNKAIKFLRYFFGDPDFGETIYVERIGVRFRYGVPTSLSFDDLVKVISEKFVSISPQAITALDAKIIDNGVPLTLETPNGTINFNIGPMTLDELKVILKLDDNPSPVSFYIDLDYWTKPDNVLTTKDIINTIRNFSEENNGRYGSIENLILGE